MQIFEWNVKDFQQTNRLAYARIFSDQFYAFDYLLQLEIIADNGNLKIGGLIMKGDFDHRLQWPFNKRMVLSICNLTTQMPLWNFNITPNLFRNDVHIWMRPTSISNDSFMVAVPMYDWLPNDQFTVRILIHE